ncbi:MAG: tungsten ABC transporter permease, partial [Thermoproteota archaeon]
MRKVWLAALAAALVIAALALSPRGRVLRVSTTTSLYATGLLDALAEEFQAGHPDVVVQFIPVGSGEALRRAEMGDADLVLVHAPSLELEYLERGILREGEIFAYNYFVVVGPPGDPAGVSGLDPVEAFSKIYEAGGRGEALFVSRGDDSGTHVREMSLWSRAGLDPRGRPWYVESGSGMSETLLLATEEGAYTRRTIGTYLKLRGRIELE